MSTVYMDTRLFSNFAWTDSLHILQNLWGHNIVIPAMVERELNRVTKLKTSLARANSWLTVVPCPPHLTADYLLLRSQGIGTGEAEAMVLARESNGIVGSDNTRDVQEFCRCNRLQRVATPGALYKAEISGLITEAEAKGLWDQMIARHWWNPVPTYSDAKSYFLNGIGRQVW